MAYITSEQSDAMRALKTEYGPTDREMLEQTGEPYGIVWMRWHGTPEHGLLGFPDRNLFIKPDGTRLAWKILGGL